MGGRHSFVACLSQLATEHASLSRRGGRGGLEVWKYKLREALCRFNLRGSVSQLGAVLFVVASTSVEVLPCGRRVCCQHHLLACLTSTYPVLVCLISTYWSSGMLHIDGTPCVVISAPGMTSRDHESEQSRSLRARRSSSGSRGSDKDLKDADDKGSHSRLGMFVVGTSHPLSCLQ